MSNSHSRQYKSSTYYKEKEPVQSKTKKHTRHKKHQPESRTPPLPTKKSSTLEELIKKRESLKQELKDIVKCSDNGSNKNRRKRGHSKEDSASNINKKRIRKGNEKVFVVNCKQKIIHESSPELDHAQIESEDEETIIQQRRQQRQQLLAKLNNSDNKTINEEKILKKTIEKKHVDQPEAQNSSKQVTDMFSDKDEFDLKTSIDNVAQNSNDLNLTDNWDSSDGYYNIRVGDVLNKKYTIKGILGQGVFANVVRAQDKSDGNDYVAIKIVRNNHLMYKTSLREIAILREIRQADPDDKYHCVRILGHFMHKGHLCILLESLHMDLRAVIKKYGKHDGLNMTALMSYTRQLLLALKLLKKLGIIHADIKPDNILVNERKNLLKLCDFGSAVKIDDNDVTPYLVSRFYRAPEIILGATYKHGVDIWSAGCTIYEMATGQIMFTGSSNNKMLKCFMELKGPFSKKLIKRGQFRDQHFNYNNHFLLHSKDEFTGRDKVIELCIMMPSRDLLHELKKYNVCVHEERKIVQLKDLIDRMTMLDSWHRISIQDCLKHPFVSEELGKESFI